MRHWEEISLRIHRSHCPYSLLLPTPACFNWHFKWHDLQHHEVDVSSRKMTNNKKNRQDSSLAATGQWRVTYGMAEIQLNVLSVLLFDIKTFTYTWRFEYNKITCHDGWFWSFLWHYFVCSLSVEKDLVGLNMCLAEWRQVTVHAMPCYINNTDVGLGWGRGVTRSPYYTPHWGSLCRCWGHTLSASLFWLALHAPIPQQILLYVCVRDLNVMQKSLWRSQCH